jgi:T5SS/PEP-CTERM-associated repeat protein
MAAALALACSASSLLHGADRFWVIISGPFNTPAAWSATDNGPTGATVPGVADVANFTLNNATNVTFSSAVTNTALDVDNGTVTFDLNGFTYRLTDPFAIDIGSVSGQTGRLTVTDGVLAVDTNGDLVTLGISSGSTGFLTISTGGQLGDGTIRPSLRVGDGGTGTLTVNENGRVDAGTISLGEIGGASGSATVTGANAIVDSSATVTVGNNGAGTLNISNGGTVTALSGATAGFSLGSDGALNVSGAGSSLALGVFLAIGSAGDGALTISAGGRVSSQDGTLGSVATGIGIATVTGANSLWETTATQIIGRQGLGTLTVSSGGRATANTVRIGEFAGGEGRATVTGTGSTWAVATSADIGISGTGELTVSNGGEFSSGAVTLGSQASGSGVMTVTGAGSKSTNSLITVGNLGNGTLHAASGGEVYLGTDLIVNNPTGTPIGTLNLDGGSIYVGDDFINNGVFNFTNGLLQVAGDFQPNAVAGAFILNGDSNADLPTVDLIGSGSTGNITSTTIGNNRRGEFRLREGRGFGPGANGLNIGALAGGSGVVKVESGAVLTTTGALTVGGAGAVAGGSGTLTISGGTVDVGTVRVFGGGVINLDGGVFAADSLPTLNGAFNWTEGEVRLDAASTSLGNFLATKLLGPAKTLVAGQTLSTPGSGGHILNLSEALTVDGGNIFAETLNTTGTLDLRAGVVATFAAATNTGLVQLGGPLAELGGAPLTNSGTIRGSGRLTGSFTNAVAGRVEVIAGERLLFNTAAGAVNSGTISVIGGELQLNDTLINSASTGLVSARDAILRFSGVTNNGSFAFSNGTVDVYGDITQNVGGRITVSNGGIANFYDDVTIQPGAASVQATALGSTVSRVVFFGSYNGGVTGGGQAFIEGDHRPGNSPALVTFGGDVVYGTFATLEMELGGTARGTQYDAINVAGQLVFNGTMNVPLISGFQPQAGNVFNLFDWGTTAGTFTTVNLPALSPGLLWSQANLYTAGEIQVTLDPVFTGRAWDGGGANNDWATDNNWDLNVEPLNNGTANLVFAGNVRLTPSVDTAWSVASITFNNTAGAFTITGPQGVTIAAGGIVNNDTQTQTITAAITLSANESFNAAAGDLSISNVALAAHTLTLTGANDIALAGASGTGTIDKNNAGTLDITGALGTGGVTLDANTGMTNITVSEKLAALNIANGATVTLTATAPGAGELAIAAQAVPEPGSVALLAIGALGFFVRRRRAGIATADPSLFPKSD